MSNEPSTASEPGLPVQMRCPTCRKWQTYLGRWDEDLYTLRCHGCLRAVGRCTCA